MKEKCEPLISIIVPVYNANKYLLRCIQSIQKQTYTNIEIILIDDGSTDGSEKICDDLAKRDKRIIIFHQENGGQASARNKGLLLAHGDLIGFVDNDDVIEPNMYEILYKNKVKENVKISGVVANWVYGSRIECPSKKYESRQYTGEELLLNMFYKESLISSSVWDKLFDRDLFDDIKFPEGCEYEDYWVLSQILLKVDKVYIETTPLYQWYQYESSHSKIGFHKRSNTYIEIPKKIVQTYIDNSANISIINAAKNFLFLGYIKFFGKVFLSNALKERKILVQKYQKELKVLVKNNHNKKVKKTVIIKSWIITSPLIYIYAVVWNFHNRMQMKYVNHIY